jgi:glycolate oxidase FAD binding subunit
VTSPRVVDARSPGAVAAALREAAVCAATVMVVGGGSKSHWGGPPSTVDVLVRVAELTGIVSHEPGDLVATVRAGARLSDVQAALGTAGQRLTLESGSPGATVGGALAAGESGPLRLRYGSGRDVLIGIELVRADGVVARSGGRVVKNVAGYDLGRLLCGSYGTLGVITQATFRLHPVAAAQSWVSSPVGSAGALTRLVRDLLHSTVVPSAIEVNLPTVAGADLTGELVVLVEGSRAGVAARAARVAALMGTRAAVADRPPVWWGLYPFSDGDLALKIAVPVMSLARVLAVLGGGAGSTGVAAAVRGSAGAGVVYAALPASSPAASVRSIVDAVRQEVDQPGRGGSCVVLATPPRLRDQVDLWGPVPGLALMRRIKDQFDPGRRFVAGRFAGGI